VKRAVEAEAGSDGGDGLGGLGSMFNDPQMFQKLANNPKTAPLLADKDFMAKLQRLGKNPNDMGMEMQDPRFMQVMSVLLGFDMSFGAPPAAAQQAGGSAKEAEEEDVEMTDARPPPKSEEPKKQPAPEPEPEEEEDEDAKAAKEAKLKADELKKKGTELYKKRQFDEAIENYNKAWELHKDITYKSNLGAAKFEKGDYQGCIEDCLEAVEFGREVRADFKLIAKYVFSSFICTTMADLVQGFRTYRHGIREAGRSWKCHQLLPKGPDRAPHTRSPCQAPRC
jgi:stress-induced-phosphoprotein 1